MISPGTVNARPRPWRKYLTAGIMDWQDCLAYRGNALMWGVVDGLPALTMAIIWLSVFAGRHEVGGYSLPEMVTYYLSALAIAMLTTPHPEHDVSSDIRTGRLTTFLVLPMDRWLQRIIGESMWQIIKFAMFLPTLGLVGWLVRGYIELPGVTGRLAPIALAIPLAYLVNVGIKMLLAALAFWLTETQGIFNVVECVWSLSSGQILPLALLPAWALGLAAWLPFKWVLSFPTELLMGRLSAEQTAWGLAAQAGWVVVSLAASRLVWVRGLKAYAAVGG